MRCEIKMLHKIQKWIIVILCFHPCNKFRVTVPIKQKWILWAKLDFVKRWLQWDAKKFSQKGVSRRENKLLVCIVYILSAGLFPLGAISLCFISPAFFPLLFFLMQQWNCDPVRGPQSHTAVFSLAIAFNQRLILS